MERWFSVISKLSNFFLRMAGMWPRMALDDSNAPIANCKRQEKGFYRNKKVRTISFCDLNRMKVRQKCQNGEIPNVLLITILRIDLFYFSSNSKRNMYTFSFTMTSFRRN